MYLEFAGVTGEFVNTDQETFPVKLSGDIYRNIRQVRLRGNSQAVRLHLSPAELVSIIYEDSAYLQYGGRVELPLGGDTVGACLALAKYLGIKDVIIGTV